MADVFISYKKEDRDIAARMSNALKAEGLSVWWDERLTPEQAFDALIEREIAAASAVVVLWTPRSVGSSWVRTEAHYANTNGKFVPVWMEKCDLPIAFMLAQTIDLSDWSGARDAIPWVKLVTWISDLKAGRTLEQEAEAPGVDMAKFRQEYGKLPNGEPVVDGATISARTPSGTAFRDRGDLPIMTIVPQGSFSLGSQPGDPDARPTERPNKRVEIKRPFAMSVYPVLMSEFEAIMGQAEDDSRAETKKGGLFSRMFGSKKDKSPAPQDVGRYGYLPKTEISLSEAQAFAKALSDATGERYRLPSESEWEYACRAGSDQRFAWGETLQPNQAHFASDAANPAAGPVPPGQFAPNDFGLYDMHGNVREWTQDRWQDDYTETPTDGAPMLGGHSALHVVRGGCYQD
ncbi:MAG: SUMF1/EgtB/PvdO family nonheme iron enzyme, partial [Pseudomonadota bacterium]